MTQQVLAVFVVSAIDFLIAVVFFLQPRRLPATAAYAIFAFTAALWGFGIGFFLWTTNQTLTDFFARLIYFAGGLIATTFYYFTLLFTKENALSFRKKTAIFLPSVVFFFFYFFTDLIIKGGWKIGVAGYFVYGPLRLLFYIHLWLFFILAFRELLKKYRAASDSALKKQIILITLGTFAALPLFYNSRFIWMGPLTTIIWVALVSYALARHRLLNAKVIAMELFVFLIWLSAVIETALSQSGGELVRKFTPLVVVGFFGYLLIRSVLREVRTREEIEKLAHNLENANEKLTKLDEAKSEFISLAWNQLRAPLTVIKGYTSLVLEGSFGDIDKKARGALSRVSTATNQLIKLVAELLDLSRIEAGKIKYEFKKMYLDDVVDEIIKEFDAIFKPKGILVEFKNENNRAFSVFGDADKLREIVVNLVDNALKYSKIGPILITLRPKSQRLLLSIQDNGVGIPQDELPRLFTKFGRTEIAQKERPEGIGLGLYFVKKIAEDHKGRVWAESEGVGKGSTFFAELPVA